MSLKMNKLIFAFVLLISISCFANAEQVELEMLCKNSRFTYDGVVVNAIHRLQWMNYFATEDLFKFERYDPNNKCSREDFISLMRRADIRKLKGEWDQIIKEEIFSPTYLNRSSTDIPGFDTDKPSDKYLDGYPETELIADLKKKIKQIDGMVVTLEAIGEKEKQYKPCLPISQLNYTKNFILNNTLSIIEGHLQQSTDFPLIDVRGKQYKDLKKTIEDLGMETLSHTMAFRNESMQEIFAKSIVRKSTFNSIKYPDYLGRIRTFGRLYFDVVLPFHHKRIDESKPCVAYTKLPLFYVNQLIKH